MFRPKRASVESQVNLQPFLLSAALSSSDMTSRQSGDSSGTQRVSNRDSGISDIVSSFPPTGNARRTSWLRESQRDSTLLVTAATDEKGSTPVYRLYPNHIAGGNKRLHARTDLSISIDRSNNSSQPPAHTPIQDFDFDLAQPRLSGSAPASAAITTPIDNQPPSPHPHSSRSESGDSFATPLSSPVRAVTPALLVQQHLPSLNLEKEAETEQRQYQRPASAPYPPSALPAPNPQPPSLGPAFEEDFGSRGRSFIPTDKRRAPSSFSRARSSSRQIRRPPSTISMGLHKASSTGQLVFTDDVDPGTPDTMLDHQHFTAGDRSSAESIYSHETSATSLAPLPPLQSKGPDNGDVHQLEPLIEDDPRSFDLVEPPSEEEPSGIYALEKRAELMFSEAHLQAIFDDPKLLMRFTSFLNLHRPQSIPLLIYYLDALKAIRAIKYANAIAEALDPIKGQEFTQTAPQRTMNSALEEKAKEAFRFLVQEDLPAYISYLWIHVVSVSIQRRITGTLAPHLREASEGLAETFCLTDPSRQDNPIVFASEEFARTTQYGMTYAIGRNCRFLQGPRTNRLSIKRLAMACNAGKEHNEVFVNYRRDGSPFLNLLMMAPLMDSRGNVRYFIGAQVDVSGLLKGCNELPALEELVAQESSGQTRNDKADRDEFQELTEMFNGTELDTVRKYGGRMHKEYVDDSDLESLADRRPRVLLKDTSQDLLQDDIDNQRDSSVPAALKEKINGRLAGVYQHYLLIRPAPSLRILFTSPSLRVPGILQSPFLHRIGGSSRVRSDLEDALADGRGVTAKVRWLLKADENGEGDGRPRWIHCTPLLGHSGAVGVWMIVLVEDDGQQPTSSTSGARSKFRAAPPISNVIGGKDWNSAGMRERRASQRSRERARSEYAYDLDHARRGVRSSHGSDWRSMIEQPTIPARRSIPSVVTAGTPGAISSSGAVHTGEDVSAPSPDVPKQRPGRSTIIDFERLKNAAKQLGSGASNKAAGSGKASASSSRKASSGTQHVVNQAIGVRSPSVESRKTAQNDFSFDLR